jgi:TetR/AcrR family transcriptional regulator, transcriptional repressor for nem operon
MAGTTKELTPKGRATRDRIVAAAAELMFARGVANTSLQDVQKATRVSGSQMYHYFPDKVSLIRAVIEYQSDALMVRQEPWLRRIDSLDGLRAWRDYMVGRAELLDFRGGCPVGALVAQVSDLDSQARGDLADVFRRWQAPISSGLRAMRERGELRPEADPDKLGYALIAAFEGGRIMAQSMRETTPIVVAIDTVIDRIASLLT